jgi:hypothetical protein
VWSGPDFDLVAQDEVGAGVAGVGACEVFTELGDGGGAAPGWDENLPLVEPLVSLRRWPHGERDATARRGARRLLCGGSGLLDS